MNNFENEPLYLGIGKTMNNSSACVLKKSAGGVSIEMFLSERLVQEKASGVWPEVALKAATRSHQLQAANMAENRDFYSPSFVENIFNQRFPFFEHLQAQGLAAFSRQFNPNLKSLTHHLCHASVARLLSPYEDAVILVVDGAGSLYSDFDSDSNERAQFKPADYDPNEKYLEENSVYLLKSNQMTCVDKQWQTFYKKQVDSGNSNQWWSNGLGTLYEKTAEYIFNDNRAAGKVMGLAAFGKAFQIEDRSRFLRQLDWSRSFKGQGKSEWQAQPYFEIYANIAASVQNHFEQSMFAQVRELKRKFPDQENLIITGGCALNCTTNMKLLNSGVFKNIYVLPFPGDEGIGLGAAAHQYFKDGGAAVNQQNQLARQVSYYGPRPPNYSYAEICKIFGGYKVEQPAEISIFAATQLAKGKIIGWAQGRSECGPRALGHRSILARVDQPGLKKKLNGKIKNREEFRPYGASFIQEKVSQYFQVTGEFESPFMSFAVKTKLEFLDQLAEITHVDGTSRIQTVHQSQDDRFYRLIKMIGDLTGFYGVLNTSLNVMGKPIVEDINDAKKFLENVDVDALVWGDYFIWKAVP